MTAQLNDYPFLVTGSAGFIGFHVARELLARGAKVVGLDNDNDYYSPALKQARDAELRQFPKKELLPIQPGDMPATFADIAWAREKLGFQPVPPLAESVPRFISWYMDYHGLSSAKMTKIS